VRAVAEQRRGVVDEAEVGEEAVPAAVGRVIVKGERQNVGAVVGARGSGQVERSRLRRQLV